MKRLYLTREDDIDDGRTVGVVEFEDSVADWLLSLGRGKLVDDENSFIGEDGVRYKIVFDSEDAESSSSETQSGVEQNVVAQNVVAQDVVAPGDSGQVGYGESDAQRSNVSRKQKERKQ